MMARQAGVSVPQAKTELAGYRLNNVHSELSLSGLDRGPTKATSLVLRSLTSAAAYLKSIGTLTKLPANTAAHVKPGYDAWVAAHPGLIKMK